VLLPSGLEMKKKAKGSFEPVERQGFSRFASRNHESLKVEEAGGKDGRGGSITNLRHEKLSVGVNRCRMNALTPPRVIGWSKEESNDLPWGEKTSDA